MFLHKPSLYLLIYSLPLLHIALTALIIPTINRDGFSNYTFDDLFRSSALTVTPTSSIELTDGSLIIVSIVRYEKDANYPSIPDEVDIPKPEDTTHPREAALIFRISSNGSLEWARRTAPVTHTPNPYFSVIADDTYIYITGATDNGTSHVGVIFRYDYDGSSFLMQKYGGEGFRFTKSFFTGRNLVVGCEAPVTSDPFAQLAVTRVPKKEGLCMSMINKDDLKLILLKPITSGMVANDAAIERDETVDMSLSIDKKFVYIEAKQTRQFRTRPVLYTVDMNDLNVLKGPVDQLDQLQRDTKIATAGDNSVIRAYVALDRGHQTITLWRVSAELKPLEWSHTGSEKLNRRIFLDPRLSPIVATVVKDVNVDEEGIIRVLLHSAENLIFKASGNVGVDVKLPDGQIRHNDRPGVVIFKPNGEEIIALQKNDSRNVEPVEMIMSKKRDLVYIVGKERGGLVLTAIGKESGKIMESSPTPTGSVPPGVMEKECVGEDSIVKGRKFLEVVKEKGMRTQLHPLISYGGVVRMLCYRDKESRFCATAFHILRMNRRLIYMKEFCEGRGCTVRMKRAIGFKGECGKEIDAGIVNITMHTGGNRICANQAAIKECKLQKSIRWLWFLHTI